MSDEDFGLMAIPIVGVVSVLGAYLVFAVYNALPWWTVSPQAQSIGTNAANTAVTAITIDPTSLLIAVVLTVGSVIGLVALISRLSGSGDSSEYV